MAPDAFAMSRHLLEARMRVGFTQQQVAERMGTSPSVISRLENVASCRPTLSTLESYALAVGCRLEVRLVPAPRAPPQADARF